MKKLCGRNEDITDIGIVEVLIFLIYPYDMNTSPLKAGERKDTLDIYGLSAECSENFNHPGLLTLSLPPQQ